MSILYLTVDSLNSSPEWENSTSQIVQDAHRNRDMLQLLDNAIDTLYIEMRDCTVLHPLPPRKVLGRFPIFNDIRANIRNFEDPRQAHPVFKNPALLVENTAKWRLSATEIFLAKIPARDAIDPIEFALISADKFGVMGKVFLCHRTNELVALDEAVVRSFSEARHGRTYAVTFQRKVGQFALSLCNRGDSQSHRDGSPQRLLRR